MTSSSVIPRPISGAQPSSVSSVIGALVPAGDGRDDRVAEAAPGAERVVHGRGLVAAVDHAVTALVVAAPVAVVLPLRRLDELAEGEGYARTFRELFVVSMSSRKVRA